MNERSQNGRRLIARLIGGESGSAMTEFVMFLPVWIIVFAGIVDLAKIGKQATAARLQTQTRLWKKTFKVTKSSAPACKHCTPFGGLAGGGGGTVSTVKTAIGAVNGHWGESATMAAVPYNTLRHLSPSSGGPIKGVGGKGNTYSDLHWMADDVVQIDRGRYPYFIVSDGAAGNVKGAFSSGGSGGGVRAITTMLTQFIAGTGAIHAMGASIRYGSARAELKPAMKIKTNFGLTLDVTGSYDVLVAPAPHVTTADSMQSWGLARLMAENKENYGVMMDYANQDWSGSGSSGGSKYKQGSVSKYKKTAKNKQNRKKCKKLGFNVGKKGTGNANASNKGSKGKGTTISQGNKNKLQASKHECKRCRNFLNEGNGLQSGEKQRCEKGWKGNFGSQSKFKKAKGDGYCNKGDWQQHKRHKRCKNNCSNNCCAKCSPCGMNCGGQNQPSCASCCNTCDRKRCCSSCPSDPPKDISPNPNGSCP